MQISLPSLLLFLFLFVFEGHEASRKGTRTFDEMSEVEEGEVVSLNPKSKVARRSGEEFKFGFFENHSKRDESIQRKPLREQAFEALFQCDEGKIDWLMENEYDFFAADVMDEVILARKYSGIKYVLMNHLLDRGSRRKAYYAAIRYGATSLVRYILNNFRGSVKKKHSSFLHLACECKRYKILRMMASEGFNANQVIPFNTCRYQLHEAAVSSDIQLVRNLLRFKDIEVNPSDNFGNTPLHYASNIEIVKLLLKNGADPFQFNMSGCDPITFAANSRKPIELIKAMLPNLNARLNHYITHYKLLNHAFKRTFVVSRERVLEESFYLVSRIPSWYQNIMSFEINFDGENGVDRGGLTREWMSLLIERLFVPRLPEETAEPEISVEEIEEQVSSDSSSSSSSDSSSSSSMEPGEIESDSETLEQVFDNESDSSDSSDSSDTSDSSDSSANSGNYSEHESVILVSSDSGEELNITDYMVDPDEVLPVFAHRTARVPIGDVVIYYNAPFECVDAENKLYRISSKFTGPVEVYKFIGSIVAKSVLERVPLKVRLVPSLIKLVLGKTLTFEDLMDDDPVMHKSMLACLEPGFNFDSAFYTLSSDESVSVTADNVMQFLDETAVESMYLRQKERIDQFVLGFRAIIDYQKLRSYFTPLEIQDFLKGSDKIDRAELYRLINIVDNHWSENQRLFWDAMDLLQEGELIEFVRFVTGINGLPFGGVSALNKKIKIFDELRFSVPKASTCNYHLNLPVTIATVPDLVQMFRIAISSEPEFTDGCC